MEEKRKNEVIGQYHESLADKIIDCLPQEPFISGSTSNTNLSRYLCWNLVGAVTSIYESSLRTIDISYADITNKKKITFIDTHEFSLAAMNHCGVFLASRVEEEENIDEYEKDDKKESCYLEFKSSSINALCGNIKIKDWGMNLPSHEMPICLAIGAEWCAVYTDFGYLRCFTLNGTQSMVMCFNHVISMTGYENHLAMVYHSSPPLFGTQTIRLKILDSNKFYNEIYDGVLPLTNYSTLQWFGYSDEGILLTYDTDKVIRGFLYGTCNNWIPLIDLKNHYENTNINFWFLGVQDEEIYGIELKGSNNSEPILHVKYPIKIHKINIPFINPCKNKEDDTFYEEQILLNSLLSKHDMFRHTNYNDLKTYRNVRMPQFPFTDNLKDLEDIEKKQREYDKFTLMCMNQCLGSNKEEKILDLFDSLLTQSGRENAITFLDQMGGTSLAQFLQNRMRLNNLKEEKEKSNTPFANIGDMIKNYINNIHISPKKKILQINDDDDDSSFNFASAALKSDNFKSLEDEVKNELELNGDMASNKYGDYNSMNVKNNAILNLEKKNVKFLFL